MAASARQTTLYGLLSRGVKLRRRGIYRVVRVEREKMRYMAMSGLRLIVIFEPFHELTMLSDLERREFCESRFRLFRSFIVNAKNLFGLDVES